MLHVKGTGSEAGNFKKSSRPYCFMRCEKKHCWNNSSTPIPQDPKGLMFWSEVSEGLRDPLEVREDPILMGR